MTPQAIIEIFKPIKIGGSLGNLSGNKDYQGGLQSFAKAGGSTLRVMGTFNSSFGTDVNKIANTIYDLTLPNIPQRMNVMIVLDNPHPWLSDYSTAELSKVKPQKMLEYCNRMPLKEHRREEYSLLMKHLIELLDLKKIKARISIELWNEINASRYFWGSPEEAIEELAFRYMMLKGYGIPLYDSGFTSSMLRAGHSTFTPYVNEDLIFNDPVVRFSGHYYRTDGSGTFDFNNNSFPSRKFHDIKITEANLFGALTAKRKAEYEGVGFLKCWLDYLTWLYQKDLNVSEVFIHPLISRSTDPHSSLALWTKTSLGYTYSKAKDMFYDLLQVITPGGYIPTLSGIRGVKESIIIENNSYKIIPN